ncbi:MAG: response regulator [Oscillatoriophycideae cyanobacterium NC_groundwater_1537_Pr4_S-0.65um_50_18]|nr:response regulator [Oscillatoriophycideae cyanobacterium NC_groundwater_1537_Pr4_S-0.65um_50_18]
MNTSPQRFKGLSLRSLLITPFVLQIFVAVGLTGYVSLQNGQKAVNDVASQLRQEMSDRLNLQVLNYLERPYIAGQVIVAAVQEEQLDLTDVEKFEHTFWQLANQDLIEQMTIAKADGSNLAVEELGDGSIVSRIGNKANFPQRLVYSLDAQGRRIALVDTQPEFDPRDRPFYKLAQATKKPAWTEPFLGKGTKEASISLSQPIYSKDGMLLGVQNSLFRISKIYHFLRELKVGQTGQTFIIDRSGNLIASSTSKQPYIIDLENDDLQQIPAIKSENPVIRATAQAILDRFGSSKAITVTQQLDFWLNNQRQFIQVSPIRDERGIDWLSIVVVPESDFMAQINANTRTTILLCLGALAVTTALGFFTSRWITKPILQLQKASQAISSGQLDQTVQVKGISELSLLADSFNQMANQLKTSFNELETRVEERTSELKEATLLADRANQAKSEFLANMSHELRTPLNGILGYAQILGRSESWGEKEHKGVEIIYQCGSHLLTLINDVLDISKIEARKLEWNPHSVYLPDLLEGVVEIVGIRAEQKGVDFVYLPDANLPEGIEVDEKRLRQVLINLLGNAVKFTDQGKVTFRVERLDQISLNDSDSLSGLSTTKLRFQVSDTGIGMSSEALEKIFHPFEQVSDQKRNAEGTGLGLTISQTLVQLMGSQIQVQSQLNEGSTFFFDVELPTSAEWRPTATSSTRERLVGYQGERQSILIADDKWANRSVIVNLLEPLGFTVIEAENGQDGLAKALQLKPNLIITDILMPVMDGYQFLQQIRQSEVLKTIPIIVSSASVSSIEQQQSLDTGADDFLAKPLQADDLFQMLHKYLQIDWIYQPAADPEVRSLIPDISDFTPSAPLVMPPPADLAELLQLAQQGRLKKLAEVARALEQQNPQYAPLVKHLLELSKGFHVEKLETFVQKLLNEVTCA